MTGSRFSQVRGVASKDLLNATLGKRTEIIVCGNEKLACLLTRPVRREKFIREIRVQRREASPGIHSLGTYFERFFRCYQGFLEIYSQLLDISDKLLILLAQSIKIPGSLWKSGFRSIICNARAKHSNGRDGEISKLAGSLAQAVIG